MIFVKNGCALFFLLQDRARVDVEAHCLLFESFSRRTLEFRRIQQECVHAHWALLGLVWCFLVIRIKDVVNQGCSGIPSQDISALLCTYWRCFTRLMISFLSWRGNMMFKLMGHSWNISWFIMGSWIVNNNAINSNNIIVYLNWLIWTCWIYRYISSTWRYIYSLTHVIYIHISLLI